MATETTVWACKKCGRCGNSEQCSCGGTRAVLAESDARKRFMESHEPDGGWYDDAQLARAWREAEEGTSAGPTPGPWRHAPLSDEVIGPRGQGVCSPCDGYDEDQWKVDARLIAAAPELLAALRAAVSGIESVEELVDLTALGDFGTKESDARRHELEAMMMLVAAEIHALIGRIDAEAV